MCVNSEYLLINIFSGGAASVSTLHWLQYGCSRLYQRIHSYLVQKIMKWDMLHGILIVIAFTCGHPLIQVTRSFLFDDRVAGAALLANMFIFSNILILIEIGVSVPMFIMIVYSARKHVSDNVSLHPI